jgi:3-hydroxypropionyl-CoA synthetase (ADP-forming)
MLLSRQTTERINDVFDKAARDGRRMLYEFEVYSILEALGLSVPGHVFVKDINEVNAQLLKRFRSGVVLKIVSKDISHKSRYGGVKRIANLDPLFIRFVMNNMREEVMSHFGEENRPNIDGFLIVDLVPFTMSLGNEILIGIKDDPSFGPVLTLSKGGDDSEFFAKYYDPANLIIAPIGFDEAYSIVSSLKIRHKYDNQGHHEYIEMMAEAIFQISRLAYQYSCIAKRHSPYIIKSMDINPFVFTESGAFIAVDGFAEFSAAGEHEYCGVRPNVEGLKAFFEPNGIVVAGVSHDPAKYSLARNIVQLLFDLGREDVFCLNPKGGEVSICGKTLPLYKSLDEIPRRYDLVVYAAPAQHTLESVKSVPDRKSVILISGIPTDMEYADFCQEIRKHKGRGLRFVGPNCMGIFFAPDSGRKGVNTLFIGEERLKIGYSEKSNTALFTQSGAMAITAIERTENAPIYRAIVSFGNKSDVNIPDLIRYFMREPAVEVLAMYIEGLEPGEGRGLFEIARASKKPVLVYKAGRTEAGAKAAASHTAAMSGDYDIFRAACAQAGIVLLEELTDFYNCMKTFSMLSDKLPAGNRVAGIVNAGLDATMGADTLSYLVQAELTPETTSRLDEINVHGLVNTHSSFLDVTPMTDDAMFAAFADAVLSDEGVDCVFLAIVPHIENLYTTDEDCRRPDAVATLLIEVIRKHGKPVVMSINSGNHYQGLVRYFEENGVPVFQDIRSAIRALDTFVEYHVER